MWSNECATRLTRAEIQWIEPAEAVSVCDRPAAACTLTPGDDGPAQIIMVRGSSWGDYAHELVHVLSYCELGAYDTGHRNRAAWWIAIELGGRDK